MTTIRDLLHNRPTERQYEILIRADRFFADRFRDRQGRFYGGILTDEEIDILDPEYRTRQASNQQ